MKSVFLSAGMLIASSLMLRLEAARAPEAQDFTELKGCTLIANPSNDGDSFHVRTPDGVEHIFRLYFVDTPEAETSFPDRVAEQASYFKVASPQAVDLGKEAAQFSSKLLGTKPFTVYTRWKDALGRSQLQRFYAFVKIGPDYLQDLLVQKGFARIYGTRTPLPDGRDSREYIAHLTDLENHAKTARFGGWRNGLSTAPVITEEPKTGTISAPAPPVAAETPEASRQPATTAATATVKLSVPITLSTTAGPAMLPAGTRLPVVSGTATTLRVQYSGQEFDIPVSATGAAH